MKYIDHILTIKEIEQLKKEYGSYFKITADIEKEIIIVGCELHADGEKILLEKESFQNNIWGGGINLNLKEVDTLAVLNLRPKLDNNSMEILDPKIRKKFFVLIKKYFNKLWQP